MARRVEETRKCERRGGARRVPQKTKGGPGGIEMAFLSRSSIIVLLILLLVDIVVEDRGEKIVRKKEIAMGMKSGIPKMIGFKLRDRMMRAVRL